MSKHWMGRLTAQSARDSSMAAWISTSGSLLRAATSGGMTYPTSWRIQAASTGTPWQDGHR